ncbi:uncharacterized protein TRIVIDRAFT_207411 [Trichoderma virens Gv29-8]|uniref:Uncharacterized protein n=1 Tax=Hypocrea virens (strain Gv29-8 / FGSC 10586) TaxID=413071 RepID=G9NDC0_HYPVG|nr:uncharacterized protein TRIVIDRAFT_207411 [Trichoderma virens Gv29-8]EHK15687.1 hypothetical protein TRIVIDRAFT_207411 [Trichoderma virens Gv29-8]
MDKDMACCTTARELLCLRTFRGIWWEAGGAAGGSDTSLAPEFGLGRPRFSVWAHRRMFPVGESYAPPPVRPCEVLDEEASAEAFHDGGILYIHEIIPGRYLRSITSTAEERHGRSTACTRGPRTASIKKPVLSSSLASKGFAPGEIVMSSRTAFAPSSSSLATAKGTRHPAAIPPDQSRPCKRTSAFLELELELIKSHGQMLAHASQGPASLRLFLPQARRTDRERLADLHQTRRHTLARWRLRASASTGNLEAILAVVGTHSDCYASHAQLGSVLGSGPGPLGCGSSLEASSLEAASALGAKVCTARVPAHPTRS